MKITHQKKHFLKTVISLIAVALSIVLVSTSCIYSIMLTTLREEVETINMNSVTEIQLRTEQVLNNCNILLSKLIHDEDSRLFFTYDNPDYLVDGYSSSLSSQLYKMESDYIDSIYLYSPKYKRVILSSPILGLSSTQISLDNVYTSYSSYDLSWLAEVPESEGIVSTELYVRGKYDNWPYLLTMVKHYHKGSMDAVAVINIDLDKLYSYLIYGKQSNTQLYILDSDSNVFLSEQKNCLLLPVSELPELKDFRAGETFGLLHTDSNNHVAYVQIHSEKYDFTYVTLTDLEGYIGQLTNLRNTFILLLCAASLVVSIFCVLYALRMRRPLQEIRQLLNVGNPLDIPDEYVEEIQDITDQIISHIQTNTKLRNELDEKLHLLTDSQMLALQTQINPHFLFNALNIISLMVESECGDDYAAVQMLNKLSHLLRYALSENYTVRMEEEVEYVEKYLSITKYRYDDFSARISIADDVKDCAIPKLILQPLIENAIQHGLAPCLTTRQCWLALNIHKEVHTYHDGQIRSSVVIEVEDNGVGIKPQKLDQLRHRLTQHDSLPQNHIGLLNVARRFYLLFRNEHEFTIDSKPDEGTKIRIVFPEVFSS